MTYVHAPLKYNLLSKKNILSSNYVLQRNFIYFKYIKAPILNRHYFLKLMSP